MAARKQCSLYGAQYHQTICAVLSHSRAIPTFCCKSGVPNLFTTSYHLGTPYCQHVPLLPEQL